MTARPAVCSNWSGIAGRDGHVFTAPVGSLQPNAVGLFDSEDARGGT
jgi:hypothetical protein